MPKAVKKTGTKRKVAAKKTTTKRKVAAKKTTRAVKTRTRTKKVTRRKVAKNQSKEKFMFMLGLLIIVTGSAIMIEILGLSFKKMTANYIPDLFLFTITIIFLVLGIGIVANRAFYSKD